MVSVPADALSSNSIAPQPLDKDVVNAAALAVHADRDAVARFSVPVKAARDRFYVGTDNRLHPFVLRPHLLSVQPNSHPGLHPFGPADRIGTDHKSVEVVVADGPGGAPGGEFAARGDFVDPGIDRRTAVGQRHLDGKPDTQTIELVFA
jgi:hypothetical protein